MKTVAGQKYNILCGRLSQEDERQGESNSIHNQQLFLQRYAEENGFENTLFLADDGYSGANFERPSWKKIVEMIERGEVETLIVKDLSRLGREYLQVGQYTEIYFPEKGVRFTAVNDSVDSLVESSNDFNPIRNWANELHAKDTSKKVRAIKKMQAERGERLGGRPPYGYRKTGASHMGLDTTRPYAWGSSTVTGILDNKVYLGHMAGLRCTTLSYKNKKLIRKPENEQVLVMNTHEPLIALEQWDIVQEVRQHKKRTPKHMDEPNMFSGLAFCADCGKPMVLYRAESMKKSQYCFKCYTYGKRGKDACTPHHIREADLIQIVLDDLRRVTNFARLKERQFAEYINQKNSTELRKEINSLQKNLDFMRRRNEELTTLFKRLYEDNVLGRVTNEQFRLLSADYNAEQKTLADSIPEIEVRLEKLRSSSANVDAFIEKAKRYTVIDELTPELLRLFIQRIEVGERAKKYSHSSAQSIRIVYRDIGAVDSAMEDEGTQPHIAPAIRNKEDIIKLLA